jgi:dTDP-4-amino-4,6-dideoxy-D-glucose acyltransferase
MGRLSREAIDRMGFAAVGDNVAISDLASFYNCAGIVIGSNVRIDDFCVLSAGAGGITIGDHVHIAVYSSLIGAGRIAIADFCNLSSRVSVYSSSDDYSGAAMTNPTVPCEYTAVTHADVTFEKHVIVGCGSVILPGVTLKEGVAIGALSLIRTSCDSFGIYAGPGGKFIKQRGRGLLKLEQALLADRAKD